MIVVDSMDFAPAAAAAAARVLADAASARGAASVALAGGSTPRQVYERLARRDDVPWHRLHVFFGDERAVPPDDPASNFRMARATLLGHAPIPAERVHRMEAERQDREAAAAEYARLLPDPLDLVVLGIGEDGHTASLFPGSPALAERKRRVVAVEGPTAPARRLTITPSVITGAGATLVLAAGREKSGAVARALEGPYDPATCPAQLARPGIWVLDRAAAAELRRVNPERHRADILGPEDVTEVISVLGDAFYDYPVMRYVLGSERDYAARLEKLITFFVRARVLRHEVLLGVRGSTGLLATALASYPTGASPPELNALRTETWGTLGDAARSRYETFGAVTSRFAVEPEHIHLNMIGVRSAAQGQGLGGLILRAVHDLSTSKPWSTGVTLSTELESNVPLYERFGYEVIGTASIASAFTTWAMFRRDR